MKNRELKQYRYPSTAELYALERAAKAARNAQIARLARAVFAGVKGVFHA